MNLETLGVLSSALAALETLQPRALGFLDPLVSVSSLGLNRFESNTNFVLRQHKNWHGLHEL